MALKLLMLLVFQLFMRVQLLSPLNLNSLSCIMFFVCPLKTIDLISISNFRLNNDYCFQCHSTKSSLQNWYHPSNFQSHIIHAVAIRATITFWCFFSYLCQTTSIAIHSYMGPAPINPCVNGFHFSLALGTHCNPWSVHQQKSRPLRKGPMNWEAFQLWKKKNKDR